MIDMVTHATELSIDHQGFCVNSPGSQRSRTHIKMF